MSIIRYIPVADEFTTYHLLTPLSGSMDIDAPRVTVLAQLDDGYTYVHVPDGLELPEQPEQITLEPVELTDELRETLRKNSVHVQYINDMVRGKIAERYQIHDEVKLLRTQPSADFDEYHAYVEACRDWGRAEKAKIGL
jgi:hypothetical protein